MKTYLLSIFALLIVGCGNRRPQQTYDEMPNDVVLNFNSETIGGDSITNTFAKNYPNVDSLRPYMPPVDKIKEGMMFMLISDCIGVGQVDNTQHLYDNTQKYAEEESKQATNNIISFSYEQPINKYTVSGIANKNSEFRWYDLTLIFHHIDTRQEFSVYGGRVLWDMETVDNLCLAYPDNKDGDVIKSPKYDVPFFFADLDFDGKDELITDLSPYGGSQRNVGAFTCIYKIERGQPIDATENFTNKSEIFRNIDQDYFMVNNARNEIILYGDGGAISFGWNVYKFNNGEYLYDRYVHCDQDIETDDYKVTVLSPQGNTIKSFTVSNQKFKRDMWNY